MEQLAHELGADLVPLRFELGCQLADTLARPAQRGLRVASGGGLDQGLQIVQQRRGVHSALLAPAPRPSGPLVALPRRRHGAGVDLLNAGVDRRAGQPCCPRCGTDATASQRERFGRCPKPSRVLI